MELQGCSSDVELQEQDPSDARHRFFWPSITRDTTRPF